MRMNETDRPRNRYSFTNKSGKMSASPGTAPETIAAIASGRGPGAVSIIRLSGPESLEILERVFQAARPGPWKPRQMRFGRVLDPESGALIDEALAVCFLAPHSFTGEDSAEIQGHGGPAVSALVLKAVLRAGARLAEPGEFTKRAFLNGRLDLTQAEAVADLVAAESEAESALAARQLAGGLSRRIEGLRRAIFQALARLTAELDFGDDLEPLDLNALREDLLRQALEPLNSLLADGRAGRPYREGLRLALLGAPNVGKSSLFNALAGDERAMVSPIAGTTRDYISTVAAWDGLKVELCDTAGLAPEALDELDALGQARAREQAARADLLLWVRDASRPGREEIEPGLLPPGRSIVVWNKIDLAPPPSLEGSGPVAAVSARSGQGLADLKKLILKLATGREDLSAPEIVPNLRHLEALSRAGRYLAATVAAIEEGQVPDICALELKAALDSLDLICGHAAPDDILREIFSRFCLGK